MSEKTKDQKKCFQGYFLRSIMLVLIIAAVGIGIERGYLDIDALSPDRVHEYVNSLGELAILIYILAYTLNSLSMVLPITPLALASGFIFGAVNGAVYLMTAVMIGGALPFFISRFFARGIVERSLSDRFRDLDSRIEKNGFKTVLFLRLVPVIPYGVFNYLCGLSKISFKHYFLASFIGAIPSVLIAALFGGSLSEAAETGDILCPKFIFASGLLAARFIIPPVYHLTEKKIRSMR